MIRRHRNQRMLAKLIHLQHGAAHESRCCCKPVHVSPAPEGQCQRACRLAFVVLAMLEEVQVSPLPPHPPPAPHAPLRGQQPVHTSHMAPHMDCKESSFASRACTQRESAAAAAVAAAAADTCQPSELNMVRMSNLWHRFLKTAQESALVSCMLANAITHAALSTHAR